MVGKDKHYNEEHKLSRLRKWERRRRKRLEKINKNIQPHREAKLSSRYILPQPRKWLPSIHRTRRKTALINAPHEAPRAQKGRSWLLYRQPPENLISQSGKTPRMFSPSPPKWQFLSAIQDSSKEITTIYLISNLEIHTSRERESQRSKPLPNFALLKSLPFPPQHQSCPHDLFPTSPTPTGEPTLKALCMFQLTVWLLSPLSLLRALTSFLNFH